MEEKSTSAPHAQPAQPLQGKRVLVTRAAHQSGKLSAALREKGAEPVEVPVIEIQRPTSFERLDAALRRLETYHWLIFTSANTIRIIAERAAVLNIPFPVKGPLVAAVGNSTAEAAREAGFEITFMPEEYVAESLVAALRGQLAGKRVLLARAAIARDVIPDALRETDAFVDVVDAYRNIIPAGAADQLRQALLTRIDAVTFTSSSTATHLAEIAQRTGIAFPFANVPAISIGPITSDTLRELKWPPAVEADPHDIPGLVAAVEKALA